METIELFDKDTSFNPMDTKMLIGHAIKDINID